jgi:hypothetical protein
MKLSCKKKTNFKSFKRYVKLFSKWSIVYECSWISSKIINVMAIPMAWFIIKFSYLVDGCILALQTMFPKGASNILDKKSFSILLVPDYFL